MSLVLKHGASDKGDTPSQGPLMGELAASALFGNLLDMQIVRKLMGPIPGQGEAQLTVHPVILMHAEGGYR